MGYISYTGQMTGDTYLRNDLPDTQSWYNEDRCYAGPNGPTYHVAYFQQDFYWISNLANAHFFDASLRLYMGWSSGGTMATFRETTQVAVGFAGATWNNIINGAYGGIIAQPITPVDDYFSIDVLQTIRNSRARADGSFAVFCQPTNDDRLFQIVSCNAAWAGAEPARPQFSMTYGYVVTNVHGNGSIRRVSVAWDAATGADSYNVYLRQNGVDVRTVNVGPGSTGYQFTDLSPGDYTCAVASVYNGKGATPTVYNNTVLTVTNGTASALPVVTANNPVAGSIHVDGSFVQVSQSEGPVGAKTLVSLNGTNTAWQYQLYITDALNVSVSLDSGETTQNYWNWYNVDIDRANPNLQVRQRFKYSDGTWSTWSPLTTAVKVTYPSNPTVDLAPTSGTHKALTASWNAVTDASSYTVQLKQLGTNYGASVNVTGTSYTWYDLPAGTPTGKTYDVVVTANFSNTYGTHGETIPQTTTNVNAQPTLPVPGPPTLVGNSPFKRAVRAATGAGAPITNGTTSSGWEGLVDADLTIRSATNNAQMTFYNLADGNHTVKWRYTWADGDKSAYSAASTAVATATPPNPIVTTDVSVPRSFSASWNSNPDINGYSLQYAGGAATQQVGTTFTANNQHSGNKQLIVTGTFTVPVNETAKYGDNGEPIPTTTVNAVVVVPGTAAPTAQGDTPYRRAIRVTLPYALAADNYGFANYDVRIMRASDNTQFAIHTGVSPTAGTTDFGTGATYNTLPDGSYYAQVRENWADGDLTAWSVASAAVIVSTPTATGLFATTNGIRTVSATWTRIADAASYDITLSGVGGSTQNIPNPASGATVSATWNDVKAGSHNVTVTPKYTNGYVGNVNSATTTAVVLLPTPDAPAVTGDSPAKRQIAVSAQATPAAYFNAVNWEFMRDGTVSSGNQTQNYTFNQVPSGLHTVQVRAKWADGDISPWSVSSPTVTTTSPPPTGAVARQRHAPTNVPTVVKSDVGGTIAVNTYFVAVSTNRGGPAAVDAATPVGETARVINESTPSPLAQIIATAGTSTITVSKPDDQLFAGDTWNVYIGTDRNSLKRVAQSVPAATANFVITDYVAPTQNDAKIGKADLLWVAPTGVGDAPLYYKVERAPAVPNILTGAPGTWSDITSSGNVVFYAANLKFLENRLDTKYWYYRITAVYTGDTSPAVEATV